jgi:hypothetical protein
MVVLLDAVLSLEGRDLLGMGQAVVYVEDEHATLGCNPGFQLLKAILLQRPGPSDFHSSRLIQATRSPSLSSSTRQPWSGPPRQSKFVE